MIADVIERFGRLDILINNAGVMGGVEKGPLETVTDEGMLLDFDVKYMGYLRCARAAVPHMKREGFGRIVNIGGFAGLAGSAYHGFRNLAVIHLSRILSLELASQGITSNVVHPGETRTERSEEMLTQLADRKGISFEDAERRVFPISNDYGHRIDAREVADIVAFLASPRSSGVTGETIAANGGGRPALFM
jgi:NAD(P)-dependent dehydrogenase (short-subunit alcohol dehydrogenase family)